MAEEEEERRRRQRHWRLSRLLLLGVSLYNCLLSDWDAKAFRLYAWEAPLLIVHAYDCTCALGLEQPITQAGARAQTYRSSCPIEALKVLSLVCSTPRMLPLYFVMTISLSMVSVLFFCSVFVLFGATTHVQTVRLSCVYTFVNWASVARMMMRVYVVTCLAEQEGEAETEEDIWGFC